jgi:hypothetical protein
MEQFEGLGSVRTEPAPRRTIKCYKLMRLVDGKLYPLYIDNSAAVELGVWYNADSPDFEFLKTLPAGYHLIEGKNTLIKSQSHAPTKPDEVREATAKGQRWIKIVITKLPQRRYKGESRAYYNVGISQSTKKIKKRGVVVGLKVEDVVNEAYAMRAGWHAGSLPTMRQVFCKKNGEKRNRDNYVFVEGEISADIDYNAEAQRNPEKDLPDKMPVDGWYLKATNADKDAAQADRVGWYVAGAIKLNRIISDSEAHAIIDRFNAQHPDDEPVLYQWPRESGKMFNADTMSLEGLHGTKKAKQPTNEGKYIDDERHKFFMRLITKGRVKVEAAQELSLMLVNAMVEISQWKKRQYESPENTTDSLLFQNRMAAHDIVTRITGELLDKGVRVKSVEAVCDMIMDCLLEFAQWKDQQHEAEKGLQGTKKADMKSANLRLHNAAAPFDIWFSGSKVVDADGNPLVVYHGTNAEFDTFDVAKFGHWDNGTKWDFEENKPLKDKGFFFTANKTAAQDHAEGAVEWAGGKPIVLYVYLQIKKPLHIQVDEFKAKRKGYTAQDWYDFQTSRIIHQYEAGDYDGIIVTNPIDESDKLFVVFKPNQIKSASRNNGHFSPDSDNIFEGVSGSDTLLNERRLRLAKAKAKALKLKLELMNI